MTTPTPQQEEAVEALAKSGVEALRESYVAAKAIHDSSPSPESLEWLRVVWAAGLRAKAQEAEHQDCGYCAAGEGMQHNPEPPPSPTQSQPPALDLKALRQSVPPGKYALDEDGTIRFYQVDQGTSERWKGFTFLMELFGAPGHFRQERIYVKSDRFVRVIKEIAGDVGGASTLFGRKHVMCGFCPSPLTKPESRAAGRGWKCSMNHGLWYPTKAEALEILGEEEYNRILAENEENK